MDHRLWPLDLRQHDLVVAVERGRALPFKAPELFSYPPVISQAADVYAFAILAWCVVAGEQPYETMESAATTLPIAVDQGVRPTLASGGDWRDLTTSSITKLIEVCWGGSAAERPTFTGGEGIVARLESVSLLRLSRPKSSRSREGHASCGTSSRTTR